MKKILKIGAARLFLLFIYCYVRFFYDICKIFAETPARYVCLMFS